MFILFDNNAFPFFHNIAKEGMKYDMAYLIWITPKKGIHGMGFYSYQILYISEQVVSKSCKKSVRYWSKCFNT